MRISDWSSDVCSSDLEPFGRIARTILQLEYLDGALSLIFVERRRAAQPRPVEHFSKLDRVLERELSPRPDREVSGMSAVAEQDDLVVRPTLAQDAPEVEPDCRAAEVRGVRHQPVAIELLREYLLALRNRCGLVERIEAKSAPRRGRTFDDKGREAVVEAVGVRRSEQHTSELQSLMRISYAVFCLKKKTQTQNKRHESLNVMHE